MNDITNPETSGAVDGIDAAAPQTRFIDHGLVLLVGGGVIGLCLFCNVTVPGLFWNSRSQTVEYFALFCAGGLVAQIGIVALWLALGLGIFRWRLLATLLLTVLIAGSYVLGLRVPDPDSLPFSIALFLVGIVLVGFILAALIFSAMRYASGVRLALSEHHQSAPESEKSGYSIGYLIGFTTLVATVIAVLQAVMPSSLGDNVPSASELLIACMQVSLHAMLSIAIVGSCVPILLRGQTSLTGYLALAACFFIGLPLDLMLLQFVSNRQIRLEDSLPWLIAYCLGLAVTTLVFLTLMRASGLRLIHCRKTRRVSQ